MTPLIPALAPQEAGEEPNAYGRRALLYLVSEELDPCVLDSRTIDLAYRAAQVPATAPDTLPAVRERFSRLRRAMLETLDRRRRAEETNTIAIPPATRRSYDDDLEPTAPVPVHPAPTQPPTPDALQIPIAQAPDACPTPF